MSGMTWLWVLRVRLISACPSISCTTLGCTPRESSSVAQVVEPDVREPRPLEERLEAAAVYVGRIKGCAFLRGEHEVLVLVETARLELLFALTRPVALKCIYGRWGKAYNPPLAALGG